MGRTLCFSMPLFLSSRENNDTFPLKLFWGLKELMDGKFSGSPGWKFCCGQIWTIYEQATYRDVVQQQKAPYMLNSSAVSLRMKLKLTWTKSPPFSFCTGFSKFCSYFCPQGCGAKIWTLYTVDLKMANLCITLLRKVRFSFKRIWLRLELKYIFYAHSCGVSDYWSLVI